METRFGNLLFTSKFDSGNLARVEKVTKDDEDGDSGGASNGGEPRPDYDFNVWTKPDCAGTPHENGNRSWFYFGVRGGVPGALIRINIMNLNRQGKLYGQGHAPFVKTVPGRPQWQRIRDRPTFQVVDTNFVLTFVHRLLEVRGAMTYFSFCYPWSYAELQAKLTELDDRFSDQDSDSSSIYYHREALCYSLDRLRVDLITVSSRDGMLPSLEPRFDSHLFPDRDVPRCMDFAKKRVYVLSARVHPGETPASFVLNGFLSFIVRESDPRAAALRRRFVFKIIPMLNPDGVMRGHYRTDSRGVNLNRFYSDPCRVLHPSIYAAKSLLVFHHRHNRVAKVAAAAAAAAVTPRHSARSNSATLQGSEAAQGRLVRSLTYDGPLQAERAGGDCARTSLLSELDATRGDLDPAAAGGAPDASHGDGLTAALQGLQLGRRVCVRCTHCCGCYAEATSGGEAASEGEGKVASGGEVAAGHDVASGGECEDEAVRVGNEGSDRDDDDAADDARPRGGARADRGEGGDVLLNSPHLSCPSLRRIAPDESGVAFYVDLHGHASKRGCFIYGNHLESEERQVENVLFPKLISLNTPHFDFAGCNFSERNMTSKDKRDGMSKEGAGRVAVFKALGITHSYTLECNYNMGRLVNCLPAARGDDGRATPPPLAGFPPKYTISHFEEVGRALAIAALDLVDSNPWSRLPQSEHCGLHGVREWVRRHLRGQRGAPRSLAQRAQQRAAPRTAAAATGPPGGAACQGGPFVPRVAFLLAKSAQPADDGTGGGGKVAPPARRSQTQVGRLAPVSRVASQKATATAAVERTRRRNSSIATVTPADAASSATVQRAPPVVSTSSAPAVVTWRDDGLLTASSGGGGGTAKTADVRRQSADEFIPRQSAARPSVRRPSRLSAVRLGPLSVSECLLGAVDGREAAPTNSAGELRDVRVNRRRPELKQISGFLLSQQPKTGYTARLEPQKRRSKRPSLSKRRSVSSNNPKVSKVNPKLTSSGTDSEPERRLKNGRRKLATGNAASKASQFAARDGKDLQHGVVISPRLSIKDDLPNQVSTRRKWKIERRRLRGQLEAIQAGRMATLTLISEVEPQHLLQWQPSLADSRAGVAPLNDTAELCGDSDDAELPEVDAVRLLLPSFARRHDVRLLPSQRNAAETEMVEMRDLTAVSSKQGSFWVPL